MTEKLDLATICPELAEYVRSVKRYRQLVAEGKISRPSVISTVNVNHKDIDTIAARMVELYRLATKQAADLVSLTDAFHDAINRPKGIVPKSGDRFYDQDRE